MTYHIRKAGVIGSGTMGSGIAALLDRRLVTFGPWMPMEALFDPAHRS